MLIEGICLLNGCWQTKNISEAILTVFSSSEFGMQSKIQRSKECAQYIIQWYYLKGWARLEQMSNIAEAHTNVNAPAIRQVKLTFQSA